jgi:predicted RNA binding protein YcfA (HicA-like mRNA interferase family)
MSKFEKRLQRLRQNPKHVRYEEIESILLHLGFEKRQQGSHTTFTLPGQSPLTVPVKKPFVKPTYVKLLLEQLVEMGILEEE